MVVDYIGFLYFLLVVVFVSCGFVILRGLNYGLGVGGIFDEIGVNYVRFLFFFF